MHALCAALCLVTDRGRAFINLTEEGFRGVKSSRKAVELGVPQTGLWLDQHAAEANVC